MKTLQLKPIYAIAFLVIAVFAILSFRPMEEVAATKEYMTMVVTYRDATQFAVLSYPDGTCEQFAFLNEVARPRAKARLKRPGVVFEEFPLKGRYDNTAILAKIQSLANEGWTLASHDFTVSVGDIEYEAYDTERVSFYLFEK